MEKKQIQAIIEAILFAVGESVPVSKLAEVTGGSMKETRAILEEMKGKYAGEESGIVLMELEDSVQLCTKPEYYDYLIQVAKTPRRLSLSDAALETLSIVAYKQPVTRLEVERIRGVNCDHALNRLLEYDLITELGRLDAPGRPLVFGTTEQFLRCFGVKSLEELPEFSTLQVEEFKEQAEAEASLQLKI